MADPPGTIALISYQDPTDSSLMQLWPQPANDPNDPLNWPAWRKYLNYALVTGMTIAAFTLVSVQLIFWQQMAVDMKLETQQLSNGQSVQLAGLASGCIFFIPLAVKYGLRPTYLLSAALLVAVTWWTARMETYAELILTNFITGLGGAVNETTVQMTISDMFFVHQRARANAIYFVAVMVGSFLTPMAAGAQAAQHGWRFSYTCLAIAFTVLTAVYVVAFEETKYVGQRPAAVRVVDMTDPADPGAPGVDADKKKDDEEDLAKLARTKSDAVGEVVPPPLPYRERMRLLTPTGESWLKLFVAPLSVLAFPHVCFTALQFASGVCWLVLLLSANSIIFSAPPYSFDTAGVGYMSLGPFVGNIFGSLYGGPLSDWSIRRFARRNGGVFEPEMRLYILMPPTILLAGGLIMFGITAGEGMHWIYPSIGGALFAFGLGSYGDIAFTFVIDTYRDLVAQAFVVVAFFRNAISIVIGLVLTPWINAMGIKYLFVTAGCISLVISLLHIPMILYGKRIRAALAPLHDRLVEKFGEHRANL